MTETIIFNVQRAITQKISKPDLLFSFSADLLMVLHICVKLTKYIAETVIFNVQRPITQKIIKSAVWLSSYFALHFCKALRKSLEPFSCYRKGTHIWLGSLFTMSKRCLLQKQVIQFWFLCFAHHIMVIHLHKVSRKYLKQFSSCSADRYITDITIFNVQRAIATKVKQKYGLGFLHLLSWCFTFVWCLIIWNGFQLTDT